MLTEARSGLHSIATSLSGVHGWLPAPGLAQPQPMLHEEMPRLRDGLLDAAARLSSGVPALERHSTDVSFACCCCALAFLSASLLGCGAQRGCVCTAASALSLLPRAGAWRAGSGSGAARASYSTAMRADGGVLQRQRGLKETPGGAAREAPRVCGSQYHESAAAGDGIHLSALVLHAPSIHCQLRMDLRRRCARLHLETWTSTLRAPRT
jgi:hypothetical protein